MRLLLFSALLSCALLANASANALVDAYVDDTITYVNPTAVYKTNDDGDTVFSHWENTHAEQRERYKNQIVAGFAEPLDDANQEITRTQNNSAQQQNSQNAQNQTNQNQVAAAQNRNNQAAAQNEDAGVAAATARREEIRQRTGATSRGLGRADLNGDSTLSDAEVNQLRMNRPSVKATVYRTDRPERKLDADGDGSFNVSEAGAGYSGTAWNGNDDGLAAKNGRVQNNKNKQASIQQEKAGVDQQQQAAARKMEEN